MKMSSRVGFAKATEGITTGNLTSGDLGGDVEGGDRDLCEGGGGKRQCEHFSRLNVCVSGVDSSAPPDEAGPVARS